MSTQKGAPRDPHPLDEQLEGSTMWWWFQPALELGIKHWPITVGTLLAVYAYEWLSSLFPLFGLALGGTIGLLLVSALRSLGLSLIGAAAYRLLAEKESASFSCHELNSWPDTLIRAAQALLAWVMLGLVVWAAFFVLSIVGAAVIASIASSSTGAGVAIALIATLAIVILILLLAPIWVSVAVAGALSTVHAVRSPISGFAAVRESLRVAFDQKWRVFWPAYVIVLIAIGVSYLRAKLSSPLGSSDDWFHALAYMFSLAFGVSMTFVIERTYAPWLGEDPDEVDDPEPAPGGAAGGGASAAGPHPPPSGATPAAVGATSSAAAAGAGIAAGAGVAARAGATPHAGTAGGAGVAAGGSTVASAGTAASAATAAGGANAATANPASPAGLAARVEEALRSNRTRELTGLVEQGLAADPRFYAGHPDSTLALSKKMAQSQRPDLALRLLTPFVKEQRGHKLHLTGALFTATLLMKDVRKLGVADKFIKQLKSLYPNEPMVDQVARQTEEAIEIANASS